MQSQVRQLPTESLCGFFDSLPRQCRIGIEVEGKTVRFFKMVLARTPGMYLQDSHLDQGDEPRGRINRYISNGGPSFFDGNAADCIVQRLRHVPLVEALFILP